ncbi:hypothetical protein BDW74DRAFT_163568 [Aspergillus multicolor]|uniref:uncharacterized protein n=1 Tax=Aspergillus multicolor TaxID=41759 RepID=UPI003CCDEE47
MDPLSCAASVIAVIQLAGALADVCGGYIRKVKNAPKDIENLKREINSLQSILESLNESLRGPGGHKLTTLQKIFDDTGECKVTLKNLSDKLNPENTQSLTRRRIFRHWKWPLQRTEVDEVISQLKGYTSLFTRALQIDLVRSTNRLEQKLDLRNLKIVEGAAYDSAENKHKECLPQTRSDLLRQVRDWAVSKQGKCIYWLSGGAGTGKSTISRTIARQLDDEGLLAGSFFFKRGEEGQDNAKGLFSTLAQHLAITIPELGPEIQKALEVDPYISGKVPAEQFRKLLLQPLINLDLGHTVTLVAVIDALDECQSDTNYDDDHDIKILLRLLPRVQASKSVRLRFFLTSRPELPIRLGFQEVKDNLESMDLHSIPTSEIAHDILIFLEYSLSRIRQNNDLPAGWPGRDAINNLLTKTVPLFISAATLCRFIGTTYDPQDCLRDILDDNSIYVSEMARTYVPVLSQLLVDQNKWAASRLAQKFKDIIGPIIVLATPLSVNALSQLLGVKSSITSDNIKSLLKRLHSVLIVPDDLDLPVRLQHLSFRDFLVDDITKDAEESKKFWIDGEATHQRLTNQCLALMEERLKQNICMLSDDCLQRSDIDSDSINGNLPPELRYACRYWTQHLMQCRDPANEIKKAISFLEVHFLHWMEVMSILGLISEVIEAISRLQSAIRGAKHHNISEFLYDASRFVLKNRHLADTAPLQLYSSGLIFCPQTSVTRNMFMSNLSDWSQVPKVEQFWSAEQQTLEGHSGWVQSVTFSPDGTRLASSSDDQTIKLWDASTGELQQTLEGHSHWVWSEADTGISILHDQWICLRGQRKLWLPQAYRPTCMAVNNGVVALGTSTRRIVFISKPRLIY